MQAALGPGAGPGSAFNDGGRAMTLLGGCYYEAMQAYMIAGCLDLLKSSLDESYHPFMTLLTDSMRKCANMLRQLHENTRTFTSRVPVLLSYLDLVLPSFQRSVVDIKAHYDDASKPKDMRWRNMYHKMTDEAGGMPLPQRFVLYHEFFRVLGLMLTRSPDFDMNALQDLQERIDQLREKQNIPVPPPPPVSNSRQHRGSGRVSSVGTHVGGGGGGGGGRSGGSVFGSPQAMMALGIRDQTVHWAEDIFSRPLPCRTPLKHLRQSRCFGPWGDVSIPSEARILYRRPFDHDRMSVIVFIDPRDNAPHMLIRCVDLGTNAPYFSMRGIHEVCIDRDGSCLVLKRWSYTEHCSKLWAVLYFLTWEEMVLFHCAFVALKFDGDLTRNMDPAELKLKREKRLFQATIIDDGYQHSLLVNQDLRSGGLRLHAAVWEGDYRRCPVWTAFITHQAQSATWLVRKDKHRVWLNDVLLYVFCNSYDQQHMRQNKAGAFELYFVAQEAAQRFKEVFYPPSPPPPPDTSLAPPLSARAAEKRPAREPPFDLEAGEGDGSGRAEIEPGVAGPSTAMTRTKPRKATVTDYGSGDEECYEHDSADDMGSAGDEVGGEDAAHDKENGDELDGKDGKDENGGVDDDKDGKDRGADEDNVYEPSVSSAANERTRS